MSRCWRSSRRSITQELPPASCARTAASAPISHTGVVSKAFLTTLCGVVSTANELMIVNIATHEDARVSEQARARHQPRAFFVRSLLARGAHDLSGARPFLGESFFPARVSL